MWGASATKLSLRDYAADMFQESDPFGKDSKIQQSHFRFFITYKVSAYLDRLYSFSICLHDPYWVTSYRKKKITIINFCTFRNAVKIAMKILQAFPTEMAYTQLPIPPLRGILRV